MLPFAAIAAVTQAAYLASNAGALTAPEVGVLLGIVGVLVAAWVLAPWDALPRPAQWLFPIGSLGLIVAMQVFALPNNRDLVALMIVPVLWSAAYGTAREAVVVTGLAVASIVTLHVVGIATGADIGVTGWTEVVALSGGLILLSAITVVARAHARTDPLTGIANRRAWDEMLAQEIARARRHPMPLAVAIIDLDEFKHFNDTRGHAEGDRHLAECAASWRHQLRGHDLLARLGGEEFAVLLIGPGPEAEAVAQRLREAVPGGETCSVGLAWWDGSESPIDLMARADDALYEAKATGRARVVAARAPLAAVA